MSIIQLTDTARILVEFDESPSCPRGDWHMLTGFVNIQGRGDSRLSDVPAVHDDPTGKVEEAVHHFEYEMYPSLARYTDILYQRRQKAIDTTVRWARVFHGLHLEWDDEHGGFWFVAGADAATYATPVDDYSRCLFRDNWPDLEPGSEESLKLQAEVIANERETYRQWAEGEVYGVVLERKQTYVRVIDSDSESLPADVDWNQTRDELEEQGSLWGCYLDDKYTAQHVAREHFDLTDEETAALGLEEVSA